MKKFKKPLPPEERILDVGITNNGLLVLCFKYFEGAKPYDGFFPFSFFAPPIVSIADLENEIVKYFGVEYSLPDEGENDSENDVVKQELKDRFDGASLS